MITSHSLFAGFFWVSVAAVGYAYAGYPALVYLLSRVFGRVPEPPELADADLPDVALLIAAHNEEAVIEKRIANALALDYPRRKLHIIVASDGSDDRTASVVRRYGSQVRLLDYPQRRGKAATLNDAVSAVDAGVVVFSDANTFMEPQSMRRLARWFVRPDVGVVCGRLVLHDHASGRNVDSVYWRYETFLKKCESLLGALLGANGAIYAIRREYFQPVPPETIIDDFVIPLAARIRTTCRIIYDCDACADEETAPEIGDEFRRRVRIGVGGFQSIGLLWRLLDPRRGWIAFTFLSHKIIRWACPLFLLGAVISCTVLWRDPAYRVALFAQGIFYGVSLLGMLAPVGTRAPKLLRMLAMFLAMNAALLVAFFRWLLDGQKGIWQPTARSDPGLRMVIKIASRA